MSRAANTRLSKEKWSATASAESGVECTVFRIGLLSDCTSISFTVEGFGSASSESSAPPTATASRRPFGAIAMHRMESSRSTGSPTTSPRSEFTQCSFPARVPTKTIRPSGIGCTATMLGISSSNEGASGRSGSSFGGSSRAISSASSIRSRSTLSIIRYGIGRRGTLASGS